MNADLGVLSTLVNHIPSSQPAETTATAPASAAQAEWLNELFAEVLHRWSVGLILLDEHGNMLFMNRAAQALAGAVSCPLKSLIDDALNSQLVATGVITTHGPMALPLTRHGREATCVMLATPLRGTTNVSRTITAVIVIDANRALPCPTAALQTLYGLSRAEARLAARLISGASLESIAQELGIKKNTARNQLKAIFQKTHTHRQGELVKLLLTLGLAAVQL